MINIISNKTAEGYISPFTTKFWSGTIRVFGLSLCLMLAQSAAAAPKFIIDTDMDNDDAGTLLYMAAAHKMGFIDLKAVTVTAAGGNFQEKDGHHALSYDHAYCILKSKLGLNDVKFGNSPQQGPRPFPYDIRRVNSSTITSAMECPEPFDQSNSINDGIDGIDNSVNVLYNTLSNAEGKVNLLVLGPWTNIRALLERSPSVLDKIDKVYAMGGSTVGGNICCHAPGEGGNYGPLNPDGTVADGVPDYLKLPPTMEFNIWADAPAAKFAFKALSGKLVLSELKATNDVVLSKAFRDRLGVAASAADATTEVKLMYRLASDPSNVSGADFHYLYWWDLVAAISATVPNVVSFHQDWLGVKIGTNNPNEGETFSLLGKAEIVPDDKGIMLADSVWTSFKTGQEPPLNHGGVRCTYTPGKLCFHDVVIDMLTHQLSPPTLQ